MPFKIVRKYPNDTVKYQKHQLVKHLPVNFRLEYKKTR